MSTTARARADRVSPVECDQCGYDYAALRRDQLTTALSSEVDALIDELAAAQQTDVRPSPDVWSAHEYACHVRDVLDVQDGRIRLTQVEDVPAFEPMGREERVAGYRDVDPHGLPGQIRENADRLIRTLEGLDPGGWERTGIYNYPEPAERTVAWIVTHTIHEVVHHRRDIAAVGRGEVPG